MILRYKSTGDILGSIRIYYLSRLWMYDERTLISHLGVLVLVRRIRVFCIISLIQSIHVLYDFIKKNIVCHNPIINIFVNIFYIIRIIGLVSMRDQRIHDGYWVEFYFLFEAKYVNYIDWHFLYLFYPIGICYYRNY